MIQTITATIDPSVLQGHAACNLWANTTIINWLRTKAPRLMDRAVPSSFPSMRETLVHIWDVERLWLGYLLQEPVVSFREKGFSGTHDDIMNGLLATSAALLEHITALQAEELAEGCFCSIPYVGDHTIARHDIVHHIIAHSSYHRGQLVTIGRSLGFTDAPMTDYMYYVLLVKNAA